MERKIGEIFEYNGEWYQCVEQPYHIAVACKVCSFSGMGNCELDRCRGTYRSDKKHVIFKKLEKVGGPFYSKYFGKFYQMYRTYIPAVGSNFKIRVTPVEYVGRNEIFIEIKQKEDMVNKKTNFVEEIDALCKRYNMAEGVRADFMAEVKEIIKDENRECKLKPFDLEAAKAGNPVCTRDGRKARIICFDSNGGRPIVALVTECDDEEETPYKYHCDGSYNCQSIPSDNDLMMLPEKKEGWINIYKGGKLDADYIYPTKADAVENIFQPMKARYIDTIKVTWEE